jgi:hypothetical protein
MIASTFGEVGITGPVLILLVLVGLVQLLLQVAALVSLYRAPSVMFGNKWVWVAVIVLLSLVGAIVYFAVGRQSGPAKTVETAMPQADPDAAAQKARSAVDLLYGDEEEK